MTTFKPPILRNDFVFIVNEDKYELACLALSYLYKPNQYLPIFLFSNIDFTQEGIIAESDVNAIRRRRAHEFSVFLNNALIENQKCENIILLGINDGQKSYLDFLEHYYVLDIQDYGDIETYLGGFGANKEETIECSMQQIFQGTITAIRRDAILKIINDDQNIEENFEVHEQDGLVVIESYKDSRSLLAMNYALSIDSEIKFVEKLEEGEDEEILSLLESWNRKREEPLNKLKEKIFNRIGDIDFGMYNFVTFFTQGLPYSLIGIEIPNSYVNIELRPDFFLFNSFIYEKFGGLGSAVIFSPGKFSKFSKEEVDDLASLFDFENFYINFLAGGNATVYNLKTVVENYPFDLLHICSHGGDVMGTNCIVQFYDNHSKKHTIEFDEVLSIALNPYEDSHLVETLYYFKKLDGFEWRSEELKAESYSSEFYATILPAIRKAYASRKVIKRNKVERVFNSNSITCSDFNYSAIFDSVGGNKVHPIIFNNICWSWAKVSTSFISSGSRGYVGTLTAVQNDKAIQFAKKFYDNVFDNNIISAFHIASSNYLKSESSNIYIYWGVHFSTLKNKRAQQFNKVNVLQYLKEELHGWIRKLHLKEGKVDVELTKGRIYVIKRLLDIHYRR
ncbi:hypothetical protein QT327_00900 [Olivibacter sp. 47]|uniref:hypothetical protein n=1 Tax=Olivibacter sp. 47 TaxID=3056486 RepID=UPI0025A4B75E|nr:hypothetical protein [Olivibacter sp. 47]MDM8172914.1 hypothetical protein [Olivibacter sp. 47]